MQCFLLSPHLYYYHSNSQFGSYESRVSLSLDKPLPMKTINGAQLKIEIFKNTIIDSS